MPKILDHVTVVRDGMHNMVPIVCYWQGQYWLLHRKAEWHYPSAGAALHLLVSADRHRWREAARFKIAGDNRGAIVVPVSDDRLAVSFVTTRGCVGTGEDSSTHPYMCFSGDGYNWSEPRAVLKPQDHLFRIRRHGGRYWGMNLVRPATDERRLELLVSDDMTAWEKVSQIGDDALMMNEADITFSVDGRATVVARTCRKPEDRAVICTADPPYERWTIRELGLFLHAPELFVDGGVTYMAGRHFPAKEGDTTWPFGATLAVWRVDADADEPLTPVLRLPATGDCAYVSAMRDAEGRLLLAYYSQHAYHWGVLPPFRGKVTDAPERLEDGKPQPMANDIYLAEIGLP